MRATAPVGADEFPCASSAVSGAAPPEFTQAALVAGPARSNRHRHVPRRSLSSALGLLQEAAMRVCLFEDRVETLEPLTLTRPAFDLRCGLRTLGETQRRSVSATS